MQQILIEVIIKFNGKYNKLTPSSVSSCPVKFNYLRESNEYKLKLIHIIEHIIILIFNKVRIVLKYKKYTNFNILKFIFYILVEFSLY